MECSTRAGSSRTRPTSAPVGRGLAPLRVAAVIRASIASSSSSPSLAPPRAKNLIPLSGIGLWLAEIITPRSANVAPVRKATPGVGSTPSRTTSTPALASPATTAASRNSPEARGSRPTNATGRRSPKAPLSTSTAAAATERPSASSAVSSSLARPRTPSVPKRRPMVERSALAVLRRLAGLLQTRLLALLDTRIPSQHSGLFQRGAAGFGIDGVERAGHTEAQGTGLTGDTTTVNPGDDVVRASHGCGRKGLGDDLLMHLVRKVVLQIPTVDAPLPTSGDDPDSGDRLLASTCGTRGSYHGRSTCRTVGRLRRRFGAVGDLTVVVHERSDLDLGRLGGGVGHCVVPCFRWCGLLGDLGHLVWLRLLGAMRVLRTGVHLELLDQFAAELVLGQHSPHCQFHGPAGVAVQQLTVRHGAQATGATRVPVHQLVGPLVAGEGDLGCVDDDDEVTTVDVRGVGRLVLAPQQRRGGHGQPTQDDIVRVDHMPGARDVARLGAVRRHDLTFVVKTSNPRRCQALTR